MCPQPGKHEVLGTLALARSWAGPPTVSMRAVWCPASPVDVVRITLVLAFPSWRLRGLQGSAHVLCHHTLHI